MPAILYIIFGLLLNFSHSFCDEGCIKRQECWFICYYLSWFPVGLKCWQGQHHLRVSVSESRQEKKMERKSKSLWSWRTSLSSWLHFFCCRVLFVWSATAWQLHLFQCVFSLTPRSNFSQFFAFFFFPRKFTLLVRWWSLLHPFSGFGYCQQIFMTLIQWKV